MQSKDSSKSDLTPQRRAITSAQIVAADTVQAEEVPTIPLGSMQTVSALQPEISVRSVTVSSQARQPASLIVHPAEYHRGMGEWLYIWWNGIRPFYLSLSLLPFVLGSVLAWTQSISAKTPRGDFHLKQFALSFIAVFCLQIGANLVNDYYDYLRGIDTSNPFGTGGLIQQGLIRPTRVLSMGMILLVLGALVGLIAVLSGVWLLLLFGLCGVAGAYFYSGTKNALSSVAVGELASFVIFGPLLTLGGYILQTGHFDRTVLIYSLSSGLLAAAAIHLNNMRDAESDAQAGKYTLASMFNLRLARVLYLLLLLGAYVPVIVLAIPPHAPHLILITLWTLPGLVVLISGVLRADAPAALHWHMLRTLRLLTLFSLLLMAALIISAYWSLLPRLPSIVLPF